MDVIKRGKIYWLIGEESVVAFDKNQATIYQMYGYPNRKPLLRMKELLLNSKEDEYNNWVEVICLSTKVKVRGYGTQVRKEWFEAIESDETMA